MTADPMGKSDPEEWSHNPRPSSLGKGWENFSERFHRLSKVQKRILVVFLGLGASVGFNYANYRAYWNFTIYNTQTVDFNLLANILPQAIREPLTKGNQQELSRVVDSHYNVFGILISRCSDPTCKSERFLALSGFRIHDDGNQVKLVWKKGGEIPVSRDWARRLSANANSRESLISQLSLPEVYMQGVYKTSNQPDFKFEKANSRVALASSLGDNDNKLGTIYFIRNPAPPFVNDIKDIADRLKSTPWFNLPDFLASRQGVVLLTYLGFPFLFLVLFELAELRSTQTKLTQERKQQDEQLSFFRTLYAKKLLSYDITNFSHDLATANQKILDILDLLTLTTSVDVCNINHDITKAPLIRPGSVSHNVTLNDVTAATILDSQSTEIVSELRSTHDQLDFVVKNMRYAGNTSFSTVLSINSILERLPQFFPAATRQNSDIVIHMLEKDAFIRGNEWQIFSILRNIQYNSDAAVRLMMGGMSRLQRNDFVPRIQIFSKLINDYVELTIEDNGPGVSPGVAETLYQWTPKIPERLQAARANGFGSDIVATYLKLNEGTVSVSNYSDSGGPILGARVMLRFKLVQPPQLP